MHLMRCIPAVFWQKKRYSGTLISSPNRMLLRGFPDTVMEKGARFGLILASLRMDLKMEVFSAITVDSSIENILRFSEF